MRRARYRADPGRRGRQWRTSPSCTESRRSYPTIVNRIRTASQLSGRWLRQKQGQVLPGSALGKAVAFALGQWRKLTRYLDHPQLTPDNNSCEQAIRPFVIGRKNWLFSGSPRGAAASALLYSLIETAKANGREPYWYLRELFEKLPLARTRDDYLALLPTARPSPPPP